MSHDFSYRTATLAILLLAASMLPARAQTEVTPAPTGPPNNASAANALASPRPSTVVQPVPISSAVPLRPIIKRAAFAEGGYILPAIVCNDFAPCSKGTRYGSVRAGAAAELPLGDLTVLVRYEGARFSYTHPNGFATLPTVGAVYFPAFDARESLSRFSAGLRVLEPRLYLTASFLRTRSSTFAPSLFGTGFGVEKFPDVDQTLSLYGGVTYYPKLRGTFTQFVTPGVPTGIAYHATQYDLGLTLKPSSNAPLFLDVGLVGEIRRNAENAPSNTSITGPFVGIGFTIPVVREQSAASAATPSVGAVSQDRDFVAQAVFMGNTEVEAAHVVKERSANAVYVAFAERMVLDHATLKGQLAQIPGVAAILTAPGGDDYDRHEVAALASSSALESTYKQVQIADHQRTIDLFQKEASSGSDSALKALAAASLPIVQEYLRLAQSLP